MVGSFQLFFSNKGCSMALKALAMMQHKLSLSFPVFTLFGTIQLIKDEIVTSTIVHSSTIQRKVLFINSSSSYFYNFSGVITQINSTSVLISLLFPTHTTRNLNIGDLVILNSATPIYVCFMRLCCSKLKLK